MSSAQPKGSCVITESDRGEVNVIIVSSASARSSERVSDDRRTIDERKTNGVGSAAHTSSSSSSSSAAAVGVARVIRVCPTTGKLIHKNEENEDVFKSDQEALEHLRNKKKVKTATRGQAVIGYARLGDQCGVLISTKTQKAMRLPTGDDVFRVLETRWIKSVVSSPVRSLSEQESANARALMEFPIDGLHFYSETFDLTRSLAFRDDNEDDDEGSGEGKDERVQDEWIWNAAIAEPLRNALGEENAIGCVPVLIQGLAESREILIDPNDSSKGSWHFAVFGKRSRFHPGTRFLARGINEDGNPGNEVEMEQIVWRSSGGGSAGNNNNSNDNSNSNSSSRSEEDEKNPKKVIWTSYVWRRGSVPLRWKQEIKQTVGDAQIEVETVDTYKNAEKYFERLRKCYGECNPIACVNLLRIAPGKPEAELSKHFHACVERCRKLLPNDPNLTVTNFDWHTNVKGMGDASAVESIWKLLRDKIKAHGYGYGTFDESTGKMKTLRKQLGVLRYNCADSLDRTNLAGFFVAVQLLAEQTKRLGLAGVVTDPEGTVRNSVKFQEKAKEDVFLRSTDTDLNDRLPEGWESRMDATSGRTFYIDHNSKSTSWALPEDFISEIEYEKRERIAKREAIKERRKNDALTLLRETEEAERKLFNMDLNSNAYENTMFPSEQDSYVWLERSVDTLRMSMSHRALSAASEVYLQNGDLHALVYTSTRASHTAMMHLLDSTTSHESNSRFKSSQSTASNLSISVQRRFVNLVSDGFRQTQFELFLGLRRKHYFPSLCEDWNDEENRLLKSRKPYGNILKAPRCAIDLVQNDDILNADSFFIGEESGLSDAHQYSVDTNGPGESVSVKQFFKSVWPCPRSSRSESLIYEFRDIKKSTARKISAGVIENWLLLTDPKGANERFAPGSVRATFLSANKKDKFSVLFKIPKIPTHATMAFPIAECAGPFEAEEGMWKYSYKRTDGNFDDVDSYTQEGMADYLPDDDDIESSSSSEHSKSKLKLTFEPRTIGTSPSALALTMALGRVEILGGDYESQSISTKGQDDDNNNNKYDEDDDKDEVGTLSPEDEAYLTQNLSLDAFERVAVEIVEHASEQNFEERLNANLMLEILRLRLRLTSRFRDSKFANLRNVDPDKLDPTIMLRTRRARRILENLRIQRENPPVKQSITHSTSSGNIASSSKDNMMITRSPEKDQTMSRSKTPILGGALTSSASLTSVATAAASKFAGFANSIANSAGSKVLGSSLGDSSFHGSDSSILARSIHSPPSNYNGQSSFDSNNNNNNNNNYSSQSPIMLISPILEEKKRMDDENERRVLTKLSVIRHLAKSMDEFSDVLSQSSSFANSRLSHDFESPSSTRVHNEDKKTDDTAEAIVEELKSRSRVKRERVKDVLEETLDNAQFLTLRGRHIYCSVAFTASKSHMLTQKKTVEATSWIEADGFKFMPPPIPVLTSSTTTQTSSQSPLFWFIRVSLFTDDDFNITEHVGDFLIPIIKNSQRTQLCFDFDGRKSSRAFVFELCCRSNLNGSNASNNNISRAPIHQHVYHSLMSRVHMFRYVPEH